MTNAPTSPSRPNAAADGLGRFTLSVAIAVLAAAPALFVRATGVKVDPILGSALFGVAILAAGFLLSWGAETAEGQISLGLILAGVAMVTVLPEYAVDFYYAYQAWLSLGW